MFKPNDKVRRKADCMGGWHNGDAVMTVAYVAGDQLKLAETGGCLWIADCFEPAEKDQQEPATTCKKLLGDDQLIHYEKWRSDFYFYYGSKIDYTSPGMLMGQSKPVAEPAKPSEKPAMGPVERFLKTIPETVYPEYYMDVGGQRVSMNVYDYLTKLSRETWVEYFDQAIAAERAEMAKPLREHWILQRELDDVTRERDEARKELDLIKRRIDNTHVSRSAREAFNGDYVKLLDVAFADHWDAAQRMIKQELPHDYDLLKRLVQQYESELRAAEELNRKWQADYASLSEETAAAKAALDNERQFFAVNQHTIEQQKAEIEKQAVQLKNAEYNANDCYVMLAELKSLKIATEELQHDNELLRAANATTAAKNDVPDPRYDVPAPPRNEIAWLVGWLYCSLSTEPLNDPPTNECRERVAVVDAWLWGVQP